MGCKGLLKCLDAGVNVKIMKKMHGIYPLSLHKKRHKIYNCGSIFYLRTIISCYQQYKTWRCKGLRKCLDAAAKVKVMERILGILYLNKKNNQKNYWERIFLFANHL